SAAFHSYPQNLRWDTYIGDYGPNFFGHEVTTGTYVINHPDYGWQAFGGNLVQAGAWVNVFPKDSLRRRVYIAPFGLSLTLEAGTFESVYINPATRAVRILLSPATPFTPNALLRIEQPAKTAGVGTFTVTQALESRATRNVLEVHLGRTNTTVELTAK